MPNKTALAIATLILLLSSAIVPTPFNPVRTSKASLTPSSGWSYYKQIDISDSGGVSANYTMKLTVYSGSGTDNESNGIIYCNNYCSNFPNDIRFGTTNNPSTATQLGQWIEETGTEGEEWIPYSGNPVLSPEGDEDLTAWGSVWKDGSTYHLFYTYRDSSDNPQIGHATSTDGKNWTKDSNNPILTKSSSGWDNGRVWDPVVWKEGSTWYMLYTGRDSAETAQAIGLATASNPSGPWTKETTNPVLEGSSGEWDEDDVENINLIKVGSTYYLWYNTQMFAGVNRKLGLATSTDLKNWTKDPNNPIFSESGGYFQAMPFKHGSYYYLLVMHYTSGSDYAEIQLYRDTNPTFYPSDREFVKVVKSCSASGWDSHDQDTPCVLTTDIYRDSFPNDELWTYYAGESGGVWKTGLLIETDIDEALSVENCATIWVKLPSDGSNTFYMFVGNSNASEYSSGDDTFIFFDDFSGTSIDWTNKWQSNDQTAYTIDNGALKMASLSDANNLISSKSSFSNSRIEALIKNDNTDGDFYLDPNSVAETYDSDDYLRLNWKSATPGIKVKIGGTLYEKTLTENLSAWFRFVWKCTSTVTAEVWKGDTLEYSASGTPEDTTFYVQFLQIGANYSYIDWILVRKYASTEPSWSSFGSWTAIGGGGNTAPTISNEYPTNSSANVELQPTCHVDVSDADGDSMTVYWYENTTGGYVLQQTNSGVSNGTCYWTYTNASEWNKTYYWMVCVNDGTDWTNETYSFTTLDDILPNWFIANEQSSSAITLEWNTSSQADSYYIRYDTSPHATWTPTTGTLLVNTTATIYNHTGLTAGTTYYYALFFWNNTYGYSTEYREDHTNTYYSTPNIVFSNETPSDGSTHVDIVNNPPDPGGYIPLSIELNDTDGGGDMEYWLYIFDWSTHTWINRIHLTDQSNQTVTQDETTFNTTSTYYYYRVCTLEGGQYNNRTYKFLTDNKPAQPIAINPLNGSIITTDLVDLKVAVYHPDYVYGWKGIDLDGANDDVRVSDDNSLNFTSSFSVDMALWIEDMPADGKTDTIISKMTDANTGWGIALYGDDSTWELMICVDGHNQTVGTATLPIETWVYLTVVFDNTTHTMYVYRNGTLVYSYNEPNTPSANTADLVIGECSYVGNDKTFDGKMDYIRVYNVALTSDEILADYYGKNDQCVKRGLVSWWKFDENTGTTTSDSWGSNDGTLEDGTAWATGTSSTSTYNCRVYNVSFYTYPGNALIGYNHSSSGFDNGEIVACNTTYFAPYCGDTYYWYAVAYDDEYNTSSSVFSFSTYCNDTEPSTVYYTIGADIYVNPQYTDNQPNTAYYTLGADIYVKPAYNDTEPNTIYYTIGAGVPIMHLPTFIYEFPTNGSTVGLGNTDIGVYTYKEGRLSKWTTTFYLKNSTSDYTVQDTQTTTLGQTANAQTVNDSLSQGTFYNTSYHNGVRLNTSTSNTTSGYEYDYSTDPGMTNPSKGRYIIHSGLELQGDIVMTLEVKRVSQSMSHFGSGYYLGLTKSDYTRTFTFSLTDDTDWGVSNMGVNAYVNGTFVAASWTEITDTNWHTLKLVISNDTVEFYVDDVLKGSKSCDQENLIAQSELFMFMDGTASYDSYNIATWDSTYQNMHFKHTRTDVGSYLDFRYDNLSIQSPDLAYVPYGYRESPEYSLSGMAKSTRINWTSTEPANTTLTVYYNLYNSTTWSGWQTATNNSAISGIADGDTVDDYKIKFKVELSTTNSSVTPTLNSLTFTVFRYTRLHVNVPINQVDTYQWYITTHNETTDVSNQTPIYTFDAYEYEEQEPSTVYYTIGADIYVNPQYTDNQPNTAYYTLGANISIIYTVQFSNPQPANSSTGQSINPNLKINVSKIDGDPIDFTLTFYSNDTVDETWDSIYSKTVTVSTTSQQIEVPYSGLQRDTQYWWKVIATNDTLHTSFSSSIYHFTTTPYLDQQPSTVYYTLGANISLGLPSVHTPYPADNSIFGQQSFTNFSVYVADPNTPTLTVTFYKASTHTAWYSTSSPNNTRVYAPKPSLTNGTWFEWYVTVADTNNNITSDTWRYKPENQAPDVALHPEEGDTTIPVKRKLVTGMWAKFVKLTANVTDVEGDDLHITIYVDDPSQPNWNDWIMRLNLENASSGVYTQDEELFNEPEHTYHWRLFVSDGYTSHNYYMNFTTDFYFWSYFTYSPSEPTQEDTVYLIDQSVNATDIAWYINGERVAYHNYSTGKHEPFNLTYTFNYSNIYNVSLWIHNDTCNNTDMWSENITVDWNVTLNTTEGGAGINYISCPLNINSPSLALQLLQPGEWIHHYNSTTESWESIWLYNSTTAVGDTFNITPTDGLAVVVGSDRKVRINLTEAVKTVLNTTVSTGYHYLGWTDRNSLDSYNISRIGLHNGDWLFYYNTSSGEWKSYRVNFTGDLFKILSHQCIIVNVGGERNLKIPWNQ